MKHHSTLVLFTALLSLRSLVFAQPAQEFDPPRTSSGLPNLQGNWTNKLATPFEQPGHLGQRQVHTEAEVVEFMAQLEEERESMLAPVDPDRAAPDTADGVDQSAEDIFAPDYNDLLLINGEYRTSVVIDPPDGRIPYREGWPSKSYGGPVRSGGHGEFDRPELRPASERCLSVWGPLPPSMSPPETPNFKIIQSEDYIVLY